MSEWKKSTSSSRRRVRTTSSTSTRRQRQPRTDSNADSFDDAELDEQDDIADVENNINNEEITEIDADILEPTDGI
ncbi:hypothetical protein BB561_005310 [Smittium simulii]|uniref:Uncharacterized protein n=1 Tax=Smittium simulii TaxID=133385 RepID=A0A2T9YAZ5_9FUNG|nr:hypothetical protein BB561_005310 [Smittium simulii]